MIVPNPVAFTLALREKLDDPDNYPHFEAMSDFRTAVGLLQQQIQVIEHLKARVLSADALVDSQEEEIAEQNIKLFNKDIELFNMQSQFDRLTEGKNN